MKIVPPKLFYAENRPSWINEVAIPDSVLSIGEGAFSCPIVNSLQMGSNVRYIGANAFENSVIDESNISRICLPSVTYIGKEAFIGCNALREISAPAAVVVDDEAFAYDFELTSVVFGNSIQRIGDSAFGECSRFGSLVLSSSASVPSIGANLFGSGGSTVNVYISSGMTSRFMENENWAALANGSKIQFVEC